MTEFEKFRLESNIRFVVTRWLLLLLGILIIGIFTFLGDKIKFQTPLPTGFLMIFFAGGIVFNILIYLIVSQVENQATRLKIGAISILQVIIDFVGVTVLIYLIGGPGIVAGVFYLLPIVEAVILYNFTIPFLISVLSSVFLNGLVILENEGYFSYPRFLGSITESGQDFIGQLGIAVSYSSVYLLTAVFLSYNYQYIRSVKVLQGQKKMNEAQTTDNRESQILQKMSDKLDKNNRELSAKELELKLAQQQLLKFEQAKSKFISVTTHQLRTPLSAIKWTFNMILGEQLGSINEEQKSFLEKGYESTQRMITIVNNLLNLDHMDAKKEDSSFTDMQIEELLENVVYEFQNQLESKNIKLVIKRPERPLPSVEADPNQIRMVVENLLDNAIKYTPKNGEVTIQIKDDRINSVKSSIEVVVKDTGIGIPESEQKKIFHKFFRATNAVAGEPDGSGIGLFISKDLIEKHGGTLWFESVESKGASFHFTLPLRQEKEEVQTKEGTVIVPQKSFDAELSSKA